MTWLGASLQAFASGEACLKDAQQFCGAIITRSVVRECLYQNRQKLSEGCLAEFRDLPACKTEMATHCKDVHPTDLYACLGKKEALLGKSCLAYLKKATPCYPEWKKHCLAVSPRECRKRLLSAVDELSPECRNTYVANSQYCVEDVRRICPNLPGAKVDEKECLFQNRAKISDICLAEIEARSECRKEVKAYCKGVHPLDYEECLLKNEAKLGASCKAERKKMRPCFEDWKLHCKGASPKECTNRLFVLFDKLSPSCQGRLGPRAACSADARKYCVTATTKEGRADCFVRNWGQFTPSCMKYLNGISCMTQVKDLCAVLPLEAGSAAATKSESVPAKGLLDARVCLQKPLVVEALKKCLASQ